MDKKKTLTLGGIGVALVGIILALILTQCHNNQPSSSSSSEISSISEGSSSSENPSSSESSSTSVEPVQHTVTFLNYDGSTLQTSVLNEGETIVLPSSDPTREEEADLGYAFAGYEGYTAGMVLGTSDMTFTASFELYSNAMGFTNDGTRAIFNDLHNFSSNRLLIPSAAEGTPVTEIAADACLNQTTIDMVFIPTSITSIGDNAFDGCDSIQHVYYLGSSASWLQITIGEGNESLTSKVLFYSETQIAQGWHYVNDIPTLWDAPVYLTTTLDATNAPVISDTEYVEGFAFIDAYKIQYEDAKLMVGQHACFRTMRGGVLYNDAATPIIGIAAITVTFESVGPVYLHTGASADVLTTSNPLTSGVRVELPKSPSYFKVEVIEDWHSEDPMNDVGAITSVVIEYTNILTPAYPIYTLSEDETSYIVTSYMGEVTDLVIPTYYNGLPVTEIGDDAFKNCTSLTSLSLPDTLTRIGDSAFQSCTALTGFDMPSNLVSIGEDAFFNCSSITYIHLPASLESIGDSGLSYMTSMTDITFAEGIKLTTFPAYCFVYDVFTTIRLPEGIVSTGFDMFQTNLALTTVYLPLSLTTIADSTFCWLDNLSDIYYVGTEEQWNAIPKYSNFSSDIGDAVIHFGA